MYEQHKETLESYMMKLIDKANQDKDYNIWIVPPSYKAIKPYVDRLSQLDPGQYPLWGIPFAVKDNIDVAGYPTTAGCKAYSYMPQKNAEVVQKLIDAGAIPVGKTNLDQFATGLVGVRSPYGPTRNALNPELISGGSSSGSAVAVARGQAVFALGTDTAGSGRVPAGLNKLIGFKPSVGNWSNDGVVPACALLDCVTVFTTQIEDAFLIDEIVRQGRSGMNYTGASEYPKRILLPRNKLQFYGPYAEQYEAAWEKSVDRVKGLGLPIAYVDTGIFSKAAELLYDGPWIAERWSDLGSFVLSHEGDVHPVTKEVLESAVKRGYDAASVFTALHSLEEYKKAITPMMKDSVLVLPTCGGTWTIEQVLGDPIRTNSAMGIYTNHCNLLQLSAIAIPGEDAGKDLPFGITLFAEHQQEKYLHAVSKLFAESEMMELAVCGLHMQGFALEKQLLDLEAEFIRKDRTAETYKLIRLNTEPSKPGLIRVDRGGASIALEVWKMKVKHIGQFLRQIPSPLGIGNIELADGSIVKGFICEGYAESSSEDITRYGGWRALYS